MNVYVLTLESGSYEDARTDINSIHQTIQGALGAGDQCAQSLGFLGDWEDEMGGKRLYERPDRTWDSDFLEIREFAVRD